VSGPLLDYAVAQGLGFTPLRGEHDQEHQFGLSIPLRGWALDVNIYHQRVRNYFDHNPIGNSSVFFPLTIAGARLYGWEVTIRSLRIARRGEVYLTYAYAHVGGQARSAAVLRISPFRPVGTFCWIMINGTRCTPACRGELTPTVICITAPDSPTDQAMFRHICSNTQRSTCRLARPSRRI
jgi:hypothetical protein